MKSNTLKDKYANESGVDRGWQLFDGKEEFQRQGLPNDLWKIVDWNENYELSPTYPK